MSGGEQNWQVGDLSLRIGDPRWFDIDSGAQDDIGPTPGTIHSVIGVCCEPEGLALRFERWPGFMFSAHSFRKIAPHIPDAEDVKTIALLNGQPVRTPKPVS